MTPEQLKGTVREVPDFPKPGINFYDVTTLFRDAAALTAAVGHLIEEHRDDGFDAIAGIESRGFVLASAMAHALNRGLILVRKPGKLPAATLRESYSLEYGESTLEIHEDAVERGQRILIVDDLLATGGTAAATGQLIERSGGHVAGFSFLIELTFLQGRRPLGERDVFSLMQYDD